ncbi:unnamed protein product [Brassica oleracea]
MAVLPSFSWLLFPCSTAPISSIMSCFDLSVEACFRPASGFLRPHPRFLLKRREDWYMFFVPEFGFAD